MKKYLKQFIKDIIPIIAGMLIALFINNWNENRKDAKYIDQIFTAMTKEFKESNKSISDILPKQKMLLDTLNLYKNDENLSIIEIVIKAKGINIPTIRMNAWKAISNSRIELIDYDKLSSLANIEEGKNILRMKTQKITDFTYSNLNNKSKGKKHIMSILISDIINSEKSIQEEINKVLNN